MFFNLILELEVIYVPLWQYWSFLNFSIYLTVSSGFYTFIYFYITNLCPLIPAWNINTSCKSTHDQLFSFFLSGKFFISPSVLKENFAR